MSRSLHTGRGIKKARLEKRALRLYRKMSERHQARDIIGHRKIGLVFRIVPDGDESLHPIIWAEQITNLLFGRNLISVSVYRKGQVEVRQNQEFRNAYVVEYPDGECSVALGDTYGVMAGAKDWSIDPDKRTIHAKTTNGYGEPLSFSWTISDDDSDELWRLMKGAQKRLWSVK